MLRLMHWRTDDWLDIIRKYYRNYKRAVSTDRRRRGGWEWKYLVVRTGENGEKTRKERRYLDEDRTRHSTIGASSELETCAHVFWNVLERQLLVSAGCKYVSDTELGLGVSI